MYLAWQGKDTHEAFLSKMFSSNENQTEKKVTATLKGSAQALIRFISEGQMRRLMPRSCLCDEYVAAAGGTHRAWPAASDSDTNKVIECVNVWASAVLVVRYYFTQRWLAVSPCSPNS